MRKKLEWGNSSYKIIHKDNVVLDRNHAACFSEFMSRFNSPYDTIKMLNIACEETEKYRAFFLQYVIDMLEIEGSFDDDSFEFKSLGNKKKDSAVMSIVRLLYESAGNLHNCDTPNLLFKPLMENAECPYEDKLQRFCYFYKNMCSTDSYFSTGHSWIPKYTRMRTTKEFVEHKHWNDVNSFFSKMD